MRAFFPKAEISPRILEEELGSVARYASSHQTDPAIKATFSTIDHLAFLTLVRMALLAPLCRMAKSLECQADPKILSEDTNKISKS